MGLLEQQKEINKKLHFYWTQGSTKELIGWVNDVDGSLRVDSARLDTIEQSKALCQWYLSICDEL
jgi:hypothetical protein